MVTPASSQMKAKTMTPVEATFEDHTFFRSSNDRGEEPVLFRPAARAISRTRPTLVPPSCIDAYRGRARLKLRRAIVRTADALSKLCKALEESKTSFHLSNSLVESCNFPDVPTISNVPDTRAHVSKIPEHLAGEPSESSSR